jgi:hypothetical protein
MGVSRNGWKWTPERVQVLTALWGDGIPAGVIGKRMGITRGMVAGKRHSLGLPARELEQQKAAMAVNGRRTALACGHVGKATPELELAKAAEVEVVLANWRPLRGSNPKPWQLRGFGECAFPVAGFGIETYSCCEAVEPGRSYCFGHVEILAGRPFPPIEPAAVEGLELVA